MKLRFATIALLMLTSTLVASCWKTDQDWSLCAVDNNLTLEFSIDGVSDAQFADHIQEFDVYLFDADRTFLQTRKIAAPDADGVWRAVYTLDPGTYYAVSWANTDKNSRLTRIDNTFNFENSTVEIDSNETGAPVYYAPHKTPEVRGATRAADDYSLYRIDIPGNRAISRPMVFGKAHRTVEVFISRYEYSTTYDGAAPIVERSGARASYDFLLRAEMTPRTLTRQAAASGRTDEATLTTVFHSALTPIQGDGWVRLYHPTTHALLGEVKIADYIQQQNITDDSYIPIQFVFDLNADVTVTLPSWLNNDITPDLR